jgi:putative ABC transport system permease protein
MSVNWLLAWRSLWSRRASSTLAVASMALSVGLAVGVTRVQEGARESFGNVISQTDLIVGARGGSLQLLLYSVFHMGQAANNIRWSSYERLVQHPGVEWTIPLSLGDSFRGHRVVATTNAFLEHYRYNRDRSLALAEGAWFGSGRQVVLGATTARQEQLRVGDSIALSHGLSAEGPAVLEHAEHPFTVSGVLTATGTPVDRAAYISLESMEAVHVEANAPVPKPTQLSALLLRAKSRIMVLHLQREVALETSEALMAVIPGVALSELWENLGAVENALSLIGYAVLGIAFIGVLLCLYASLAERRRELAILRALGAGPGRVFALLVLESFLLTGLGVALGTLGAYAGLTALNPWIEGSFGLQIPLGFPGGAELAVLGSVLAASLAIGLLPAARAYKNALADGLQARV